MASEEERAHNLRDEENGDNMQSLTVTKNQETIRLLLEKRDALRKEKELLDNQKDASTNSTGSQLDDDILAQIRQHSVSRKLILESHDGIPRLTDEERNRVHVQHRGYSDDDSEGSDHEGSVDGVDWPARKCCSVEWWSLYTFYIMGMVTLLPYTFFVTANDYWMYKLRDVTQNTTSPCNRTTLQAEFTTYLTIAASGPSVFFMIINSLLTSRISIEIRMFGSLVIILLSFLVTTVFVELDTDTWQDVFFTITLATVILVNVFGAILTASLYGIACKFSSRYISAVSSGQALGGLFPAIAYIWSIAIGATSTHSALLYFCTANLTIAGCLAAYYFTSRSMFFQYHMIITPPANTLSYDPMDDTALMSPRMQISIQDIFFKCWEYGVSAMTCYIVTLAVYPGVSVLITSVNPSSVWTDKYFVPVVTFFVFSLWDYIGRMTAGFFKWPIQRKWITMSCSLSRIVFIPLFLLCNAHPRVNLPVLINSDTGYVALTCLLGFSNGYLTNIILINVPKIVDASEQEAASSIIATFISIGCAAGALLSFIFVRIL